MDVRTAILNEHSKEQCTLIVNCVGANQDRFDSLFQLFIYDEYRVVQRVSWPVSNCVLNHPKLIENNFDKLIANLNKTGLHDAVKRNTVRLFSLLIFR